jgi:hypothetical protein
MVRWFQPTLGVYREAMDQRRGPAGRRIGITCRARYKRALKRAACPPLYSLARRSSCALIATMTVLADISTAANAGGSRIPLDARTPAAKGIATML